MFSRFVYGGTGIKLHYLLWLHNILLHVYATLCLSIHLPDLGCFYLLSVNHVAVNTGYKYLPWVPVFKSFEDIHRSWIAGSYGNSTASFLRNYQLFTEAVPFYIPISTEHWLQFLHVLMNTIFYPIDYSYSGGWEVLSRCSFHLPSLMINNVAIVPHYLCHGHHLKGWFLTFPLSTLYFLNSFMYSYPSVAVQIGFRMSTETKASRSSSPSYRMEQYLNVTYTHSPVCFESSPEHL